MQSQKLDKELAVSLLFSAIALVIFGIVPVYAQQSTAAPRVTVPTASTPIPAATTPRPQVDNPSPADLKKRMESEKPYSDCKKNEQELEKRICNTGPSAGANMSRSVNGRTYECEKGKLKSASGLTPRPNGQGGFECITEREVADRTGNPACANLSGSTNPADPNTCVAGLRPIPTGASLTLAEVQKMKERTGIRCMLFKGKLVENQKKSRFSDITPERQIAATTGDKAELEVCGDDAHKLQGSTAAQAAPDPKPLATTAAAAPKPDPKPLATTTAAPTRPDTQPLATTNAATAVPAKPDPRPLATTTAAQQPFVPANQQGPVQQPSQQIPSQQPYQTGNQQPTGVQTGRPQQEGGQRQQRDTTPVSAPVRVAQSTPQRESWISSWLSPKQQESQAQQPIIINNNNAQPWFIAEMKRMEDARLKVEIEKKQLADKLRREAEEKKKTENEKKLAKETSSSKQSKTEKVGAEATDVDPQATFLKALMDAPSIEDIAKQYAEEQKKEAQDYAEERTKTVAAPKALPTQQVVKIEQPTIAQGRNPQPALSTSQKRPQQAYTDIAPFVEKTEQNITVPTGVMKSSLVSMLDEEAIKKGIPAPRIEEMPLPEKIAFTRTSYTVVVPNIRQTIKTILRADQKGDLTQLERDRHAAQLVALSEQLAGSAYGADYDTTQVLNDAASATELTAFMIAEHADNKAVSDSLYGIFATLTPLTKSEPVALTPPSGSLKEWSEQHFALIKYKIETAMEDTDNEKAKELYTRALSLVKSAELYKDSDQQYWNSSADIKEAVRTLSLATALDRASRTESTTDATETNQQKATVKAQTREALLKDKGSEKGIWSSFLNMLGL